MGGIVAGVTVMQDFCRPGSDVFQSYIDYMDREEAQRNDAIATYNLYHDYMGNPEKTTGLFTAEQDSLNYTQKKVLKDIFQMAQDNGSIMWQTVISFDNRWLEQNGVYNSKKKILDERKLKEVVRISVKRMLEKEGLECAVWSAAIHYNTDNIHVHIATVEPYPMREKILYKGNMEYRGKFKLKNINQCKSAVVNEIMQTRNINILINDIIRKDIVKMKEEQKLADDPEIREKFLELYGKIPMSKISRNLIHYNNGFMNQFHSQIDEISNLYLDRYHKTEFEELKSILKRQSDLYSQAYGYYDRSYEESKIKDLYERLGNAILKEIKDYDKRMKKKIDKEFLKKEHEFLQSSAPAKTKKEMEGKKVEQLEAAEERNGKIPVSIQDTMIEIDQEKEQVETARNYDFKLKVPEKKEFSQSIQEELILMEKYFADFESKTGKQKVPKLAPKKTKMVEKYRSMMKAFRDVRKMINRFEKGEIGEDEVKKVIDEGVAAQNPFLLHLKGELISYGRIYEMNPDEAKKYFETAFKIFMADEPILETEVDKSNTKERFDIHAYVQYRIGKQLNRGWGVEEDCVAAAKWYEKSGEDYARYALGNLYFYGEGVEKDFDTAFSLYRSITENAYASLKCAEMYKKGLGCEPSEKKSEEYYQKAFRQFGAIIQEGKQTDGMAEYEFGRMLYLGEGCKQNLTDAIKYLEISAEQKNIYAQYLVSTIYIENEVEEKIPWAIDTLTELAEKGNHSNAQYALGKLYTEVGQELYDIEKGIKYFSLSAEQDNEYAQYMLGKLYSNQELEIYNLEKGISYLEQSAEKENEYAQYWLGKLYTTSEMDIYDLKKGIEYLEKSAEQGNEAAMYRLGKMYMNSKLEVYDLQKGIQYLEPLMEKGNESAKYILGVKYLDKSCELYDPEKGIIYISELAESGNSYAQTKLGCEYLKGENIEKNSYLARQWLEKAAAQGDAFAANILNDISESPSVNRGRRGMGELDKALRLLQKSMEDEHRYSLRILKQYEMEQEWNLEQMEM